LIHHPTEKLQHHGRERVGILPVFFIQKVQQYELVDFRYV